MQLNGKIVVVPLWLIDSIKESGLSISSLTNLNILEEHFSSDDIISYHAVNKLFDQLTFRESVPEMQEPLEFYSGLFKHLDLIETVKELTDVNSVPADTKNLEIAAQAISNQKRSMYSNIEEETLVFLKESDGMKTFFNTMTAPSYQLPATNPNIYVINLFHIENQTFGLTIKPYDGIATDSELATLNDNMKLLFTHYKYEEVCQTQIFHRWCFTIKRNQQ